MLEFLGADLDTINFSIQLSAFCGVNPKNEVEKLREIILKGEPINLVVAGEPIGDKWIIESVDESVIAHDAKGNIIKADIDLALKEYPIRKADEK